MVSRLMQSALCVAVYVWFGAYFARWYEVGPDWIVGRPVLTAAGSVLVVVVVGAILVIAANSERRP